jgi:hypothetical protein
MTNDPSTAAANHHPANLEKAEHGLAMPYDAERVAQLRSMLREARKQKLSARLKARGGEGRR